MKRIWIAAVAALVLLTCLPDDSFARAGFRGAAIGGDFRGAAIGGGFRGGAIGGFRGPIGGGFRAASLGGFRGPFAAERGAFCSAASYTLTTPGRRGLHPVSAGVPGRSIAVRRQRALPRTQERAPNAANPLNGLAGVVRF